MADSPDDLSVPKPDAGVAFRLEMWFTNVLLGYWWVLVLAVVAVLVGVLVYGFWDNSVTNAQQAASKQVEDVMAEVRTKLLDPDAILQYEQFPGQDGQTVRWGHVIITPSYAADEAPSRSLIPLELAMDRFGRDGVEKEPVLLEAADKLMAVQASHSGASGAQAALYAAELYRLAGNDEGEAKALDAATGAGVDTVAYPAAARKALRAADAGNAEEAEATLRPWIKKEKGYFGQQAAYDLGRAYEALGREADAEAVYRELLNTWQTSPLRDQVDERLEAMGVAAVPMPAPEEGTPAEHVPAETPPADDQGEGEGSE